MRNFLFFIVIAVFFFSCAQVVSPTGGPKDEISPQLIKSIPPLNSVNFLDKTIRLQFNEQVEAKDFRSQFVISPYIKNPYNFVLRRNTLIINFENNFEPNTTYTFYFREGVVDFTEKNPAQDLKLVFSTGSFLDSLSIEGKLKDLKTNKPLKNVTAMLYDAEDTFDINKGFPFYFVKTDTAGIYHFQNIRQGSYKLYALNETDKNFLYTEREEKIAFLDTLLIVDTAITDLNLKLIDYDNKIFRYLRTKTNDQYVLISFNKPFFEYQINFLDTIWKEKIYHRNEKENIILFSKEKTDSIEISFIAKDSLGQIIEDTVKIKFDSFKEKTKKKFKMTPFPKNGTNRPPKQKMELKLYFNKPIKNIQNDSIVIMSKQDTGKLEQDFVTNFNGTIWTISEIKTNIPFILLFKEGSFISVEEDTLIKTSLNYGLKKEEDCGIIEGNILGDTSKVIIQLLNNQYKVISELYNKNSYQFSYIKPGIFYIRVIKDINGNKKWDIGNFIEKVQPEPVYFFPEKITVKANWELLDINVEIDSSNSSQYKQ